MAEAAIDQPRPIHLTLTLTEREAVAFGNLLLNPIDVQGPNADYVLANNVRRVVKNAIFSQFSAPLLEPVQQKASVVERRGVLALLALGVLKTQPELLVKFADPNMIEGLIKEAEAMATAADFALPEGDSNGLPNL